MLTGKCLRKEIEITLKALCNEIDLWNNLNVGITLSDNNQLQTDNKCTYVY
jgi:hypothetical protein